MDNRVGGTVAPGFEPVSRQLSHLIASGEERGCAVAAYVDGKPVVDIWAGHVDDGPWQEDTLCLAFSVTKGLSAMCVQVLSDRGAIDVDAPVARYWPEYAAQGKGATLVKHLLNHTAAQFAYPDYWRDIGTDYRAITDQALIAGRLAEAPPAWEPGIRPMYHALTYGHLVGELVRRVDGRTLGKFFHEEIAKPLGIDFWIGLPRELISRVARPRGDVLPRGRRGAHRRRVIEAGRAALRNRGAFDPLAWPFALTLCHPDRNDPTELSFLGQNDWGYSAELPASNGTGTARSLARLYAMLAGGGEIDGTRIVSQAAIRRFSDPREGAGFGFALGYVLVPPFLKSAGLGASAFGSAGAGGSLALADPDNRVSFALTKNQMRDAGTGGYRLILALYSCLGRSNRATRIRRAAMSGFLNNRPLSQGTMCGVQWLSTFRGVEHANPMAQD